MKLGYRKPSFKKSLKARTTGKAKRTFKQTIDPAYDIKGSGYIKNPKKAVYNKAHNKTTRSVIERLRFVGRNSASTSGCVGCVGCFPIPFIFFALLTVLL